MDEPISIADLLERASQRAHYLIRLAGRGGSAEHAEDWHDCRNDVCLRDRQAIARFRCLQPTPAAPGPGSSPSSPAERTTIDDPSIAGHPPLTPEHPWHGIPRPTMLRASPPSAGDGAVSWVGVIAAIGDIEHNLGMEWQVQKPTVDRLKAAVRGVVQAAAEQGYRSGLGHADKDPGEPIVVTRIVAATLPLKWQTS